MFLPFVSCFLIFFGIGATNFSNRLKDTPANNWAKYEMYFGLSVQLPNGTSENITITQFKQFLGEVVTPKFPDGFSWREINGQYFGSNGLIFENSVQVIIYAPFIRDTALLMNNISRTYASIYRQDSVLVAIAPATLGGSNGLCLNTWNDGSIVISTGSTIAIIVASVSCFLFVVFGFYLFKNTYRPSTREENISIRA